MALTCEIGQNFRDPDPIYRVICATICAHACGRKCGDPSHMRTCEGRKKKSAISYMREIRKRALSIYDGMERERITSGHDHRALTISDRLQDHGISGSFPTLDIIG